MAGLATTATLFGSFTIGQATVLGIALAGNALISALVPVQSVGALSAPSPSPTYSLQAQGNTARLEQVIPVQYGRLLLSPDLAAMPYTEFVGGELFLYQLMCLGAGEYVIEDIRIEDTPITSFSEVTTEIVVPNAALTLFPSAVISSVEVSGQTLAGLLTGTWTRSGTAITVTQVAYGRAVGQGLWLVFTTGSGPSEFYTLTGVTTDSFTVTGPTGVGSGNVNIFSLLGGVGGFVANGAGTLANFLAFDLVLPFGLYGLSGSNLIDKTASVTFQAVPVDSAGVPTGAWVDLATEVLTDRTSTPVRRAVECHHRGLADRTVLACRYRNLLGRRRRHILELTMPALPTSGELTGAVTNTHIAIKTAVAAQRDFLAGLLGTTGTIAAALAALGVPFTQLMTKTAAYTVVSGDRGDVISASGPGPCH